MQKTLFRRAICRLPLTALLFLLAACSKSDSGAPASTSQQVTITAPLKYEGGMVLPDVARLALLPGETATVPVAVLDGTLAPVTSGVSLEWRSDDLSTVQVAGGQIRAVRTGTATLTVGAADKSIAPATITVQVVADAGALARGTASGAAFSPARAAMPKGSSFAFSCKAYDSRGTVLTASLSFKLLDEAGAVVDPAFSSSTKLNTAGTFTIVAFAGTTQLDGKAVLVVYDPQQQQQAADVVAGIGIHEYADVFWAYGETSRPVLLDVYRLRTTQSPYKIVSFVTVETPAAVTLEHGGLVTVGNDASMTSAAPGATTAVFEFAGRKTPKADLLVPIDLSGTWQLATGDVVVGALQWADWSYQMNDEAYLAPRAGIGYSTGLGRAWFGGSPGSPDRTAAFMATINSPNRSCLSRTDGASFSANGIFTHLGIGIRLPAGPLKNYRPTAMAVYLADGKAYGVYAVDKDHFRLERDGTPAYTMERDAAAGCGSGQAVPDSAVITFKGKRHACKFDRGESQALTADFRVTFRSLPYGGGTVTYTESGGSQHVAVTGHPDDDYFNATVTYTKTVAGFSVTASMYGAVDFSNNHGDLAKCTKYPLTAEIRLQP